MRVYRGFESWNANKRTSVSLGNYDGVHIGHRVVLEKTVFTAIEGNLESVAITFDPVPKKILQPDSAPPLIQTLEQRLVKLESLRIQHAIVVPFSEQFARKTPEQFVQQYLIDCLRVKAFVIGEGFSFGHQKRGDISLLKEMGDKNDFHVQGVPEIYRNGIRVSSSQIREFIRTGKMEDASDFLGEPFTVTGTVVEGEHLGRKIGIPTANLSAENEILPAKGVYVCRAITGGVTCDAVTNVGVRPTVGGTRLTVEAHLLDFSGELYGSRLDLQFFKKIRDEKRFSGIEQLKSQIHQDIQQTRDYWTP